jgi:PKHD-type hydroxylase
MLVRVPRVLSTDQVRLMRTRLDAADAPWVDGRATAGHQGARVKHNRQIAEDSDVARELGAVVIADLERNPLFLSATLALADLPAAFQSVRSRRGDALRHARRRCRGGCCRAAKIRTDVSATLFLSAPDEYDGGELQIDDTYGTQRIKLPAGIWCSIRRRAAPSDAGDARSARRLLLLGAEHGTRRRAAAPSRSRQGGGQADARFEPGVVVSLTGCYHNLLRMWRNVSAGGEEKARDCALGPASLVAGSSLRRRWRILGLSGSILVYDREIDALLNPARYATTGVDAPLAFADYMDRAARARGDRRASAADARLDDGPIVVFARRAGRRRPISTGSGWSPSRLNCRGRWT